MLLDDHVVLVVGGGSGLGLGVARHCLREGARVAVLDVSAAKLDTLAGELGELGELGEPGDSVLALRGDVTVIEEVEAARESVIAGLGRVDAVIATQGIFDGNVPLDDVPSGQLRSLFDEIFHVNVLGHVNLAKVFHHALDATGGAMVLTASTAAYAADGGGVCYSASKGAVCAMVQQLAFEFAPRVRVNGVAPAGIANSQLRGPATLGMEHVRQSDIPKDAFLSVFRRISLLTDLPTPDDHGPIYAFLASRSNTIMTGQMIVADQGLLNRAVLTERQ